MNSLGSCFGSTGAASINPATGERYRLDFPEIAVEDIARAGYETLRALGVEHLAAVIGASLGGMSVVAFATQFPKAARRLISISGSPAASPVRDRAALGAARGDPARSRLAGLASTRLIIRRAAACAWRANSAPSRIARPLNGASASAANRSPATRDSVSPFAPHFAVEGYLEAQAERFTRVFDANCYLYLSSAMDRFDLAEHGGSYAAALREVSGEAVLMIGVESDMLFAIGEQASIAVAFEHNGMPTRFARLPSLEGHDSFLVDIPRFDAEIRSFLA